MLFGMVCAGLAGQPLLSRGLGRAADEDGPSRSAHRHRPGRRWHRRHGQRHPGPRRNLFRLAHHARAAVAGRPLAATAAAILGQRRLGTALLAHAHLGPAAGKRHGRRCADRGRAARRPGRGPRRRFDPGRRQRAGRRVVGESGLAHRRVAAHRRGTRQRGTTRARSTSPHGWSSGSRPWARRPASAA